MNRLKYVLGINVPRPIPSNICKRHHSDVLLLKSSRLFSSRTKKPNDFRSVQYARQQRSGSICTHQRYRPKSGSSWLRKPPLEKNLPVECGQKRRKSSACRSTKEKRIKSPKDGRNFGTIAAGSSIEKEPRSYAQIIASYDEAMCTQYGLGVSKDCASSTMINRIHRSPFSTASTTSFRWNDKNKTSKPSMPNQKSSLKSEFSVTRRGYGNHHGDIIQAVGGTNELERTLSYATIIEKYSNAINSAVDYRGWNGNLIPKRNASTKLDVAPTTISDTESIGTTIFASDPKSIPNSFDAGRNKVTEGEQKEASWATKVEDIIKDLKRITAKKEETEAERWALSSVNERAHWLDRVVSAHKKRTKERRLAGKTKANEITESKDASRKTGEDSMAQGVQMTDKKPSNPISEYIRRGPVKSNASRTTAAQSTTTAATNPSKEPQIELRMTPSQNESFVSINVDELAAKTGAKDQLSVVISSKRSSAVGADAANPNPRTDFGSMQISISENTVPVKQIEFSINGKPVSELKSIVARADRLDVVGSMDKVEIRIPSKNTASVSKEETKNVTANPTPVLNLNIAAKFNEPRQHYPKDTGLKPETTPVQQRPPPVPEPQTPQNVVTAPKSEETKTMIAEKPEEIAGSRQVDIIPVSHGFSSIPSEESDQKTEDRSSQQPSMNTENPKVDKPIENRASSNMIPWWSSEDAFKKIKKQDNSPRNVPAIEEPPKATSETKSNAASSETSTRGKEDEILDEKKKSTLDEVRVVRVKSPRKLVAIKPANRVKSPRYAKLKGASNRLGRKIKNRAPMVEKQEETLVVSPARSPKIVKYVAVKPSIINVDQTAKEAPAKEASTNEKPNAEQETKTEANVEKSIVPHGSSAQAGKENVQNTKTVLKVRNFEKHANRSADVSAKSTPPSRGSGLQQGKEQDRDKADRTTEKDLSRPNVDAVSDQRIDEILKTMKPIEKRKDGTLIDYGVTVPSRTPSRKFKRDPNTRTKTSINVDEQPVFTVPSKQKDTLIRSERISSSKKEGTLTKSKGASNRSKIVEPEKIVSVKKNSLTEPKSVSNRPKVVEPAKIVSSKKREPIDSNSVSNQPKVLESMKISSTKKDTKIIEPEKVSAKTTDAINKSQATPESKETSNKPSPNSKINPTKASKSTLTDKVGKVPENTVAPSQFSRKLKSNKEMASFEATNVHSSRVEDKKVTNADTPPLMGTITTISRKPSAKVTRNDNGPVKESTVGSEKRLKGTGVAPLKGTIKYESSKGTVTTFITANKEEKAMTKIVEDKPRSNQGGGNTESSGPASTPIGPSGSVTRSFMMMQSTSADEVTAPVGFSNRESCETIDEQNTSRTRPNQKPKHTCSIISGRTGRTEKDILYSSWLQRFNDNLDDDKIL